MRKQIIAPLALAALLAACTAARTNTAPPVAPVATGTPASVCADIVAVQQAPDAAVKLDAQDPHSALGVLWADAKASCPNGVPAAGVSAGWAAQVWAMAKAVIPQVLPELVPLIVGAL